MLLSLNKTIKVNFKVDILKKNTNFKRLSLTIIFYYSKGYYSEFKIVVFFLI